MLETQEEMQVQDDTASRINAFKKARETEQDDFDVYVYRVIQDTSKKIHHPFLTKYNNYLPDEAEIAEKFRGGRYKLQAIWYQGKAQKSQSWSYEIDESTFPVQSSVSALPMSNNPGDITQNMMLIVADIMKTAYAVRPGAENEVSRRDPLEMFTEVQGKMSEMYNSMLNIQQNVMERAFKNNLERKFGLIGGTAEEQGADDEQEGNGGIMQSGVIEIVKQIVDGAKLVLPLLGIPGSQPVIDSIKKNPQFSKYAELAKNPAIVKEVAQALRKEYGDKKAGLLLKSFGINMVARPGVAVSAAVPVAPGAEVVQAVTNKQLPGSKKQALSKVKKG